MEELMHRIPSAAKTIAVSRTRLYELIRSGEIESVKIGRSRLIPTSALQEYVERVREAHQVANASSGTPEAGPRPCEEEAS